MNIAKIINQNLRAIFYALTVVLGIFLALSELDDGRVDSFRNIAIIVSLVFVIEIYSGWRFRKHVLSQTSINRIEDYSPLVQFIHHLLLPLGLYFSILLFGYFNNQPHLRLSILIVSFISLTILFSNIRAYYLYKVQILHQTNYIYDITKFLIFFCVAQALYSYNQLNPSIVMVSGTLTLLAFALINLMLVRYQKLETRGIIVSLVASLLVTFSSVIMLKLTPTNPLQMSFVSILSFYIASALIHHKMDRSLSISIIFEYIVVLLLSIGLLIGFR